MFCNWYFGACVSWVIYALVETVTIEDYLVDISCELGPLNDASQELSDWRVLGV